MAETHTIKPDGGGDYTTLQAAEDAQDGDIAGRGVVTLECYDGTADLGITNVSGWSNTDSSNYVRIFVPLAERHAGVTAAGGSRIDADVQFSSGGLVVPSGGCAYLRIEGLRVNVTVNFNAGIQISSNLETRIDSCLVVFSGASGSSSPGLQISISSTTTSLYIRNNILYDTLAASKGIKIACNVAGTVTAYIQNNTVDSCTTGIEVSDAAGGTLNVTLHNNICTNNSLWGFYSTVAAGTVTGNNNCSEDATANDWDGSGSIINQTPADLFVTEGSDHTLKAGSNAINAGKTIAGFDNDALHLKAEDWRPKGVSWDMGALEYTWTGTIGGVTNPTAIGGIDVGGIGSIGGVS